MLESLDLALREIREHLNSQWCTMIESRKTQSKGAHFQNDFIFSLNYLHNC